MQKNSNTDYPKLSFITNSSLNQLLIIQNQPQLQLSPKHKSNTKILSKPPSLEILIELLTNQNKLYENKQQIIDYLRALNPFDSIIKQFHMNNTNEVYKEIRKTYIAGVTRQSTLELKTAKKGSNKLSGLFISQLSSIRGVTAKLKRNTIIATTIHIRGFIIHL